MDAFLLTDRRTPVVPRHDASMLGLAAVVHVVVFALVIGVGMRPVRVNTAGSPGSSIGAYISDAIGTAATAAPKPVARKKSELAMKTAKAAPKEEEQSGGGAEQAAATGAGQAGGGPVRIGSGGSLNLLKRVEPLYPPIMRNARMTGQVVLDAVIHADGTIGDVTVLQSTNGVFAQSAIAAVKQWRYAPPGFEAILTVTVNYTLT